MFHVLLALLRGLRGFARGLLAFRNLHDIASHLVPTLCSPPSSRLLDSAPISPLDVLEEFTTPSSLISIENPAPVLPSAIPAHLYQSDLVTVTPTRFFDLVHILLLLAFISGLALLLPGILYVFSTFARRISALFRLSSKNSNASIFKSAFSLVPNFVSTPTFSLCLLASFNSLLLLWTGPLATASFFTLIYVIFKSAIAQKFSNMVVKVLQRCGFLTIPDTQTPPILNAIYEQIVNKTVNKAVTFNFNWRRKPKQETPTFTGVDTDSYLGLQYSELELINSLTQHKLELEQEIQHRLRTQQIYAAYADSQKTLRQQLEVSRTREGRLKADLIAAERERRKLKDLIATLEASDVGLRADLAATVEETREAAIMFDQQSKTAAEKDHVIRSTKKALFAVRADLQDAEEKIARLDAELDSEHKVLVLKTKELDEQVNTRRCHEAEMRRIAMKTEDIQKQLENLSALLWQFRDRTQSLLDDAHTHHLNHAITITPDDTGQPPPPLKPPIPDVRIPRLDPIARFRPSSQISLRQTPEQNPHDPTARHPPDPQHRIFAWLGRLSDWADSWRAGVESLLEVLSYLDAERAREAESRERSERCLQEKLEATKDELGATQGELTSTMEELGITQEELASTMEELGATHEELAATKEHLRVTQEEVSNAHNELDRERQAHQNTRAHAEDVSLEFETCKAKLKDVQDARRATIDNFCNAVELLRQRNADLESLRAEAEASKSESVTLSAILRKRVEILEAEVKWLSLNQKFEESYEESQLAQVNSPIFCPEDKANALSVERPFHDSPPSSTLPSISPPSNPIRSLDDVPLSPNPRPDVSGILPPSRTSSLTFLPVGSSVGSVDWPPIGSTLQPSGKNAEQDSGVGILRTLGLPLQEVDKMPATFRNPLNLPLPQIFISRPFILDPLRFGVHGGTPLRSCNAVATGPREPDNFASASHLHPEASGSHLRLSSHTPPGSPPPRKGIGEDVLERSTWPTPEPPLPRLLPGFLDSVVVHEYFNQDSPCTFNHRKRGRRPNLNRAYTRQYIPTLDYGLPKDFVPGTGRIDIEPPDRKLDNSWDDDFASVIPFDCPTSTPVALSKRLASKQPSESLSPDGIFPSFSFTDSLHQGKPPVMISIL